MVVPFKANRKGSFANEMNTAFAVAQAQVEQVTKRWKAWGVIKSILNYENSPSNIESFNEIFGLTYIIEGDNGKEYRIVDERDPSEFHNSRGTPGNIIGKRVQLDWIGELSTAQAEGSIQMKILGSGGIQNSASVVASTVNVGFVFGGGPFSATEIGPKLVGVGTTTTAGEI